MDYRYETKDDARDFHKQRKAFVILNIVSWRGLVKNYLIKLQEVII